MHRRLASSPLFSGMAPKDIAAIAKQARVQKFKPSEVIVRAGEPSTHFYVILAGIASYFSLSELGHKTVLWNATPGSIVGFGALVNPPMSHYGTASASCNLEVAAWEHRAIHAHAMTYPLIAENALRLALCYFRSLHERLTNLKFLSSERKLAYALYNDVAVLLGRLTYQGIEIHVSNDDLAAYAQISPFTVSRILQQWMRQGIIRKGRGWLLIPHKSPGRPWKAPDN